jgi:hypothetical protein
MLNWSDKEMKKQNTIMINNVGPSEFENKWIV